MRRRNWRLVVVGSVLAVGAAWFFLYMQPLASKSDDPVTMMQTVGMVSGGVGGLALAMLALGLIGRRK